MKKDDTRYCTTCGEPLSDDEKIYCKRCKYELKRKTRRRRIITAVCVTVAVGALGAVAYVKREELKKRSKTARAVYDKVREIPSSEGFIRVKKLGSAAEDKVKEIWVRIDDKISSLK